MRCRWAGSSRLSRCSQMDIIVVVFYMFHLRKGAEYCKYSKAPNKGLYLGRQQVKHVSFKYNIH